MKNLNPYIQPIEQALANLAAQQELAGLNAPIAYQLSLGGKRLRPALAMMACHMWGGAVADVLSPALGIEVFHNFTLLHDDVMDKADIRRGKPTVHKKWDENTAILAGDAMQIIAYQLMCRVQPTQLPSLLELFSTTALEITKGQQLDLEFETRGDVTQSEYLEMIRLKTAVLLGCALKTGAIVAGAPAKDADLLYQFGENIGLAFQLQDDLLDVYGDVELFGKKIGGDILNNKKTFLLIEALQATQGEQHQALQQWIATIPEAADAATKVEAVTHIYNQVGIKERCEAQMQHHWQVAQESMKQIEVEPTLKLPLLELAQELMYRTY